jgi:hypothetical protein
MNAVPEFPWSDAELDARVRRAVDDYWAVRMAQADRQRKVGRVADSGTRSEVTGGKHLDGLQGLLIALAVQSGFREREILSGPNVELPGFFRPTKKWDVVIVRGVRLCAVIELKSQAGSFGNNLNNRTEEALGSAVDINRAFRAGLLGDVSPFVGYVALVQDAPDSNQPVRVGESVFPADRAFIGRSYAGRYEMLCNRMVAENHYTAAALILSPRSRGGEYRVPSPSLSVGQFLRRLHTHLIASLV